MTNTGTRHSNLVLHHSRPLRPIDIRHSSDGGTTPHLETATEPASVESAPPVRRRASRREPCSRFRAVAVDQQRLRPVRASRSLPNGTARGGESASMPAHRPHVGSLGLIGQLVEQIEHHVVRCRLVFFTSAAGTCDFHQPRASSGGPCQAWRLVVPLDGRSRGESAE